ncbi:hypothetical protein I7I51_02387, partial [Histoplasma capsulatum]
NQLRQQRAICQQHRSCPGQRTIGSLLQLPRQRAQGSPRRPQGASSNVEIANRPAIYRKFQVGKSSALGLILPLNLQLMIYNAANGAHFPSFVMTDMYWVDVLSVLPPLFSIYPVSSAGVPEPVKGYWGPDCEFLPEVVAGFH